MYHEIEILKEQFRSDSSAQVFGSNFWRRLGSKPIEETE